MSEFYHVQMHILLLMLKNLMNLLASGVNLSITAAVKVMCTMQ